MRWGGVAWERVIVESSNGRISEIFALRIALPYGRASISCDEAPHRARLCLLDGFGFVAWARIASRRLMTPHVPAGSHSNVRHAFTIGPFCKPKSDSDLGSCFRHKQGACRNVGSVTCENIIRAQAGDCAANPNPNSVMGYACRVRQVV